MRPDETTKPTTIRTAKAVVSGIEAIAAAITDVPAEQRLDAAEAS